MESLLNYPPEYGIDKGWVDQFRKVLDCDIRILKETDKEIYFFYKSSLFSLTNNGLEFNLSTINIHRHDSIHYVSDGMAYPASEIALEIIDIVKYEHDLRVKTNKTIDFISKITGDLEHCETNDLIQDNIDELLI